MLAFIRGPQPYVWIEDDILGIRPKPHILSEDDILGV